MVERDDKSFYSVTFRILHNFKVNATLEAVASEPIGNEGQGRQTTIDILFLQGHLFITALVGGVLGERTSSTTKKT